MDNYVEYIEEDRVEQRVQQFKTNPFLVTAKSNSARYHAHIYDFGSDVVSPLDELMMAAKRADLDKIRYLVEVEGMELNQHDTVRIASLQFIHRPNTVVREGQSTGEQIIES